MNPSLADEFARLAARCRDEAQGKPGLERMHLIRLAETLDGQARSFIRAA